MKFDFEDWIKKFGSDDLTIKVGKCKKNIIMNLLLK